MHRGSTCWIEAYLLFLMRRDMTDWDAWQHWTNSLRDLEFAFRSQDCGAQSFPAEEAQSISRPEAGSPGSLVAETVAQSSGRAKGQGNSEQVCTSYINLDAGVAALRLPAELGNAARSGAPGTWPVQPDRLKSCFSVHAFPVSACAQIWEAVGRKPQPPAPNAPAVTSASALLSFAASISTGQIMVQLLQHACDIEIKITQPSRLRTQSPSLRQGPGVVLPEQPNEAE